MKEIEEVPVRMKPYKNRESGYERGPVYARWGWTWGSGSAEGVSCRRRCGDAGRQKDKHRYVGI